MQLEYSKYFKDPACTTDERYNKTISLEDVLDITSEKVNEFSKFLLEKNAISEDQLNCLNECSSFDEPTFKATASKMMKILKIYLLLSRLGDKLLLPLKKSAEICPRPGIFEKMILGLETNAIIDQKVDNCTRLLLTAMKHFPDHEEERKAFNKTLGFILVTGRFEKVNLGLKRYAKALKFKEESLVDHLVPHRIPFVLVNAPFWSSDVRKIAIRIAFEPLITLNIDKIRERLDMLTELVSRAVPNYKNEIIEYLKFEAQKFSYDGLIKNAKDLEAVYQDSEIQTLKTLHSDSINNDLYTENSIFNVKVSQAIDEVNRIHDINERLIRLHEILPDVDFDILAAINVGCDDSGERREVIRENLGV